MSQVMTEISANTFRNPLCDVENLGILLKQPEGERKSTCCAGKAGLCAFFSARWWSNEILLQCEERRWEPLLLTMQNMFEMKAKKAGSDSGGAARSLQVCESQSAGAESQSAGAGI